MGPVEHLLILGDCIEAMEKMDDKSVDFIFTDPPYGHFNNDDDLAARREYVFGGKPGEKRPIANDGPGADELFRKAVEQFYRILKPGACVCCCCAGGGGMDVSYATWSLYLDEILDFKHMIVWDKGPMGMGWHYRRSYELILVAQRQGARCKWYDTTNRVENIIRPGYKGIRKLIPGPESHPTEKPVNLVKHFMTLHTEPGDLVLDPFMGRGTTGVACEELGRNFIGIETDEYWYQKAKERIDCLKAQEVLE